MSRPSLGQGSREFTSRHRVLCFDSEARHCVATRLYVRDKDALSRHCGAVLHRDREDHVRVTNQARRALA